MDIDEREIQAPYSAAEIPEPGEVQEVVGILCIGYTVTSSCSHCWFGICYLPALMTMLLYLRAMRSPDSVSQ